MQPIAQSIEQTPTAGPVEVANVAGNLLDAMLAIMARRHTRRVVQGLSEAQLRDSGINRAAVLGNRPVIQHEVRLATYLASLR